MSRVAGIIVLVVAALLGLDSFYVIQEGQLAIVTQFGEYKYSVHHPGVYPKVPFADQVTRMERRILGSDTAPAEFLTRDKKKLVTDPITRWRIVDPLAFFKTVHDESGAKARLDDVVNSELRGELASHDFSQIIGNARDPLMQRVAKAARKQARRFGIDIVDVRIKRADLPTQVQESVFKRMQAERSRIAKRYRAQGCCGALSVHSGRAEEARRFARSLIDTFERAQIDYLVVNAAGCGSSLKEYGELLQDDPAYAQRAAALAGRVRDLAEILVELGPVAVRHPLPLTVAYHDACHLAHAQGVRAQPRTLLAGIPGLQIREITDAEICCGSAGIWNVLNPEPARELGDRKARNVIAAGAQLLVTANPGCLMQIAASMRRMGQTIGLAHTAEVLDASIQGTSTSLNR
jgi:regulator of protease activity HflC (stomatin/prohibitin superfamily)